VIISIILAYSRAPVRVHIIVSSAPYVMVSDESKWQESRILQY